MISTILLVGGSLLLALGGALIASGMHRGRPTTVVAPVIVLDLREPVVDLRGPVIDLSRVGQVWTASPASSSRRER